MIVKLFWGGHNCRDAAKAQRKAAKKDPERPRFVAND
jgi:hypothetical protein